ncbi:MAG TPA: 4-hydroxythreonine-4-phosphate dehydrogenase PdxA [Longimicrobiales bacterium]|nr:4-hydroxythreonine-4-phosphate dehydrogenase PdxA [Longimicrobiales bacterium]
MTVRLAVTLGDPRGIGPEVVARAAVRLLREAPRVSLRFLGARPSGATDHGLPGQVETCGRFDGSPESAGAVSGAAVERAVALAQSGEVDGVVTGPIHKPALQAAGYTEPGHTELLQRLTGAPMVGMLMAAETTRLGGPLRVLLATTHLPLREVPDRITPGLLVDQARLLERSLREGWAISRPRLALCALNPHASDGGLFGDEEERIMAPAVTRLREAGVEIAGPLPADTVFSRALAGEFDAVVAPYHDVGMAAFKTVSFGAGVNVTLGLPFPRTSPDHGTAFDLAGKGVADATSTLEALRLAARLAAGLKGPEAL